MTAIHPDLYRQFNKNARWTLCGSICYESLKVIHCFLLLHLLPPTLYGLMGGLFSFIYLTTYIADLGLTNSIPPFLHIFAQSRAAFKRFLIRYSLLPHLPFIIVCACVASVIVWFRYPSAPHGIIVVSLIILETIRSFLRVLLHTTFHARRIVVTELSLFLGFYLLGIWLPYLIFRYPLTLYHLFIPHLIDSALCVGLFVWFSIRYYKTLPVVSEFHFPPSLPKRVISVRLFNYLLRVGRNFFTGNFLTPLFAVRFGLASAGLFYFASVTISAMHAVVKGVISYSGNALLANVKNSTCIVKKDAFNVLCQKLVRIVLPVVLVLAINYKAILRLSASHNTTQYTLSLLLLYCVISFADFFFILYEQFYIIEEAANRLFFFKLFEFVALYAVISSPLVSSPVIVLLGLMCIRFVSFAVIAINAFYLWNIKPHFTTNLRYIMPWIIIATLLALVL